LVDYKHAAGVCKIPLRNTSIIIKIFFGINEHQQELNI